MGNEENVSSKCVNGEAPFDQILRDPDGYFARARRERRREVNEWAEALKCKLDAQESSSEGLLKRFLGRKALDESD